jgi:hypothetical protein
MYMTTRIVENIQVNINLTIYMATFGCPNKNFLRQIDLLKSAKEEIQLTQHCNGLYQSQIGLLGNHYLRRELFQWRNASSTWLRSGGSLPRWRCNHLTDGLALTSKRSGASRRNHHLLRFDGAFSHLARTGTAASRPPTGESMRKVSLILWESPDANQPGLTLDDCPKKVLLDRLPQR